MQASLVGTEQASVSAKEKSGKADPTKAAAAAKSADALLAPATPGATLYKIGPQDVLDVSVFKVPELSKSVQVADTGTINLPLVGDIAAAGQTAQDIERDLSRRLGAKYLRNPQVTVFVKEYNSQRITVEGAVKKPGVFPYRGRATLLQAIAMAEGLDAVSDTNVVVFRSMNGKRAAAKFDISDIRTGKAQDPTIESGDVVVVATNSVKETFQNILKALPLAGVFALL
ncbi:MAG: polysaccharide biosynthesis/export family protein [Hyphomicrobiaceae bacterium]|nr:polysaccharide biosynthesis/export family protein [Hyphomicrobiaceae bacterium]